MSGAYKFRCLGRTSDSGRCRRRCRTEYSFCPIHESQRLSGAPLEVEHTAPVEPIEVFKDGDMTQRSCGHSCNLTLDKCCECIDARAADAVPAERRSDGYCTLCKTRHKSQLPAAPVPDPLRRLIEFRNVVMFQIDEQDLDERDNLDFLNEMILELRERRRL